MLIKQVYPGLVNSPAFIQSLSLLNREDRAVGFTGITEGLTAPLLAAFWQALNRPLFCLTPDQETAESIYDDLVCLIETAVSFLPAPEILPYEKDLTHVSVARERLKTLSALAAGNFKGIIIAPVEAVFYRTIPSEKLKQETVTLAVDQELDSDDLLRRLVEGGYEPAELVEMSGEFCRRGGIVDVFASSCELPVRIEFFGDTIESIRQFDPLSQRSKERYQQISLLPHKENFSFSEETEQYQPLSFFNYLPAETLILFRDKTSVMARLKKLTADLSAVYREKQEQGVTVLAPERLIVGEEEFREETGLWQNCDWDPFQGEIDFASEPTNFFSHRIDHLAESLRGYLDRQYKIIIWASGNKEADRLEELITAHLGDSAGVIHFAVGKFKQGFLLAKEKLLVLSEREIFHRFTTPHRFRRVSAGAPLKSFTELKKNDYVVHQDHGIGRYLGIEHLVIDNKGMDFITIEYAGEDKLFLPASQIREIEKYLGSDHKSPALNKLGTATFAQLKTRVKAGLLSMAKELLELYAARESQTGICYEPDNVWQREFETAFPYEETPDQYQAILDVKKDMEKAKPMDRLVCGDVGYGKTEVAMRAAFKAVMNNRQVAVLVPTTILAQQHFNTFSKRMAEYPVKVGLLCRFLNRAEQAKNITKIKSGDLDIVIGTHRILSGDIRFKNLGLLIIDEEQRFGVRHKEKIKQLKTNVDVLTLTATPIPRTLHLALSGSRDMSVINTPPADRLPIKTFVLPYESEMVRAAIVQELKRGGQVFFVHNRIEDIEKIAHQIKKLVPETEIGIAHGRLPEKELEEMMRAFLAKEFNVLLATTIIENGLDMPNVNTIIITKADRFGLSQLYQLRGRVGRAGIQAFAYLFYSSHEALTSDSRKRLAAISEFDALGAGFKIAMKDLEIRGTGNLLGKEQHGKIAQVGFDLYCKLLAQTINELKGDNINPLTEPEIKLTLNAFLPDDYITSSELKIDIYKNIAAISSEEEKENLVNELVDRFGALPEPALELFRAVDLRLLCSKAGVESLNMRGREIIVRFAPTAVLKVEAPWFLKRFRPQVRFLSASPPQLEINTVNFDDKEVINYLLDALAHFSNQ